MYLKILLSLLPLMPTLVGDVEKAVELLRSEAAGADVATAARKALHDLTAIVDSVLSGLGSK